MLNPEGVVNGNYRTGLSGHDLNRHYEKPSKCVPVPVPVPLVSMSVSLASSARRVCALCVYVSVSAPGPVHVLNLLRVHARATWEALPSPRACETRTCRSTHTRCDLSPCALRVFAYVRPLGARACVLLAVTVNKALQIYRSMQNMQTKLRAGGD